ncbi:MAG TPA: thiamine-phosphate kinase [Phycisphaerae bacterium]|nr:thiamine-phosphate kinase [Phycisphaerae bacterium]
MPDDKGEGRLINWIRGRTRLDPRAVPLGPGDDMAIVRLAGESECLVTVDALIEGTHFDLEKATPRQVGYKALAVSLSDAAAMAALPVCAVAWVALPNGRDMAFAKEITRGLADAAERFACPIVGGDVVSGSGPLSVGTALVARADGIEPVRRAGAKPGDWLFVTGELGGSVLGRHLSFVPRVAEARILARTVMLHAMIDLSDGLSTDLGHLCEESRAGAEVEAEAVPISADARRLAEADGRPALEHALNDGEDFELLFAVGPEDGERLVAKNPLEGVPLSRIGRVTAGREVTLVRADGRREPLEPRGWEHFQ